MRSRRIITAARPPHSVEMLGAKLSADEDLAVIGAPPDAGPVSPVFVRVAGPAVADETSKHQIPSRILRL